MQNKVVIITGASSGIGKALVYEFAKRGAKISMGARNLDELQKIETDLNNLLPTRQCSFRSNRRYSRGRL